MTPCRLATFITTAVIVFVDSRTLAQQSTHTVTKTVTHSISSHVFEDTSKTLNNDIYSSVPDCSYMNFIVSSEDTSNDQHALCVYGYPYGGGSISDCSGKTGSKTTKKVENLPAKSTSKYKLICKNGDSSKCHWKVDLQAKITCQQAGIAPNQCSCKMGNYFDSSSSKMCYACNQRSYQDKDNHYEALCKACPAGFTCPRKEMSQPLPCKNGEYCSESQDPNNIQPCPAGQFCEGGKAARLCKLGFYCPLATEEELECSFPWVCFEGSDKVTGSGIRDEDKDFGLETTDATVFKSAPVETLPFHPVVCKDSVLTAFKMQATMDNHIYYKYSCDDSFTLFEQSESKFDVQVSEVESLVGVKVGCGKTGDLLTGFSFSETTSSSVMEVTQKCSNVGSVTNEEMCEEFHTKEVPLFLEGERSTHALAHLSAIPIRCQNVGQGVKSFELEIADFSTADDDISLRYSVRCCEIGNSGYAEYSKILNDFTKYTNGVTSCGARHGWISPEQVEQENIDFKEGTISDSVTVLANRAMSVINGLEKDFSLSSVTEQLIQFHKSLMMSSTVDEAIKAAELMDYLLTIDGPQGNGRCPSAPIYRWRKACSGTNCNTALEYGLESSWENASYQEFVKGVTESREEMYGTEIMSGTENTSGSTKTVSDTFSIGTSVSTNIYFTEATVELGYDKSYETSDFEEETIISSTTRTLNLSTGISENASKSIGSEIVRTSTETVTRTCETSCESSDDNQIIVWQWISEQTDPNAKRATIYTCTFVCRSAAFSTPPLCPGGQCLNNDCSTCIDGTFSNSEMDALYSSPESSDVYNMDDVNNGEDKDIGNMSKETSSKSSPGIRVEYVVYAFLFALPLCA